MQSESPEEDYPPISALNDLAFCPRRCAMHRLEGLWLENSYTLHGTLLHARVDSAKRKTRGSKKEMTALRIISHCLKLQGVADLVEFQGNDGIPYPVEFKRGKKQNWVNDNIQLCAQALCLEEMLAVEIPKGAIYHVLSRQRREVEFSPSLRAETKANAAALHALLGQRELPVPAPAPHCRKCSLRKFCLPRLSPAQSRYQKLRKQLFQVDP